MEMHFYLIKILTNTFLTFFDMQRVGFHFPLPGNYQHQARAIEYCHRHDAPRPADQRQLSKSRGKSEDAPPKQDRTAESVSNVSIFLGLSFLFGMGSSAIRQPRLFLNIGFEYSPFISCRKKTHGDSDISMMLPLIMKPDSSGEFPYVYIYIYTYMHYININGGIYSGKSWEILELNRDITNRGLEPSMPEKE